MQDKSFVGLGNLIPKETLKASTYVPATGATGAASGASGMKMKDSKAIVDGVALAMLKRLENVKATEGKKAISKLRKRWSPVRRLPKWKRTWHVRMRRGRRSSRACGAKSIKR